MDEDRRDRTLWCGGLDPKVTEELLRELFVQAGPLEDVKIPKDSTGRLKNFAFITFTHAESVGYTLALMEGVSLYGRNLRLERRPQATVDDTYIDMMKRHYEHVMSRQSRRSIYERFSMAPPSFMMHRQPLPSRFGMDIPVNLPLHLPPVSTPVQHHYVPTPIHTYVPTPIRNRNHDASTTNHSGEQQGVRNVQEYFTMESHSSRPRQEEPLMNYQCSETNGYSGAYQAMGNSYYAVGGGYHASGDGYRASGDGYRAAGSSYNAASDGYYATSDEYHASGMRRYRRNDYSGHQSSYDHQVYHAKRRRY